MTGQGRPDVRWAPAAPTSPPRRFVPTRYLSADICVPPLPFLPPLPPPPHPEAVGELCAAFAALQTDQIPPARDASHWEAAPLSRWRRLETGEDSASGASQSGLSITPTMWCARRSRGEKHHLLRHLVFMTCRLHDGYSSTSSWK